MNEASCPDCSLPASHCVCHLRPSLQSRCRFSVLMHEDELSSPTNTGRFVTQCLVGSHSFAWQRTGVDGELLERLDPFVGGSFILFPADRAGLPERAASWSSLLQTPAPHLVLLDGTWKQARKILRKSPYLDQLPLISLERVPPSRYDLRRGAEGPQLCTLEAAAALLDQLGERHNAQALAAFLDAFCNHYRSFKSGHPPHRNLL